MSTPPSLDPPPLPLLDEALDPPVQTLMVVHVPSVQTPFWQSPTAFGVNVGAASGLIHPLAQSQSFVQNATSSQVRPAAQSAFAVQTIGAQNGPPWHVWPLLPFGHTSGGGGTASAEATDEAKSAANKGNQAKRRMTKVLQIRTLPERSENCLTEAAFVVETRAWIG